VSEDIAAQNEEVAARWIRGDMFGLDIPADIDALVEGGEEFLTRAFRTSGALSNSNRVARIVQCEACFGGGTGSKALLALEYATPQENLPNKLFIKFSRNFHDAMRDRSKHMMVSEVKFAALSRTPQFPIPVPQCLFADVNEQSGTGLMITDRIAFGNGIEPQYVKCMDYLTPAPLKHYEAIIKFTARACR